MIKATVEIDRGVLDTDGTRRAQVLKPQLLKGLYDVLFCLSLDSSSQCSNVKFTDIRNLSDFLFNELSGRFKQLFSDLGIDPTNVVLEKASVNSDTWGSPEDLTLLLRCCMVLLHFLEFDLTVLLEKCQILFDILSKLCHPELASHLSCLIRCNGRNAISIKRSVSLECTYVGDGGVGDGGVASALEESEAVILQKSGSAFLRSVIEVFIDELLVHRKLRMYFMMVDTISCTNEKLFKCHLNHGDSDVVLELISAHFLLSVSDEQEFNKSVDILITWNAEEPPFLEQSLTVAMQLIGTPTMFSAPQILQAYMVSLAARCIGINMPRENQSLDPRLMNYYISSFERSFVLYDRHMTSLLSGDHPEDAESRPAKDDPCITGRGLYPSFESYVRPVTYNQINVQATKFSESSHNFSSKKETDLLSACISYMKENQNILEKSCRDEMLSILSAIISRILSGEMGASRLLRSGDISQQELYLLASIMKLMSCSLLQTVWSMQSGNLGCVKTLKDYSQCAEYDFIIHIIGCIGQYNVCEPIQSLIHEIMADEPARHKESKQMFMHFAGLLLYSFEGRLEFLCKGCVFMMMTLMNFFIFEAGSIDAFKPLPVFGKECLSSRSSSNISSKFLLEGSTSLKVASKFQKFQMLNIRMDPPIQSETAGVLLIKDVEECMLSIVEEDRTCDGRSFIRSVQGDVRLPDLDDLADFVECKKGKDYSRWLKDRETYRKWKWKKTAGARKERKRRIRAMF